MYDQYGIKRVAKTTRGIDVKVVTTVMTMIVFVKPPQQPEALNPSLRSLKPLTPNREPCNGDSDDDKADLEVCDVLTAWAQLEFIVFGI